MRIQKIQKALAESESKEIEFRQLRMNTRNNKGMDKLIEKTLPSWIKTDHGDKIPLSLMRKKGDQEWI